MDMCPERERYQREVINQYKSFEMRRDEDGALVLDHCLMIKEYSRSSADQGLPLPSEMRSSATLLKTIKHILKDIVTKAQYKRQSDNNWYEFISNRTRSIQKDITQQRLNDSVSVQMHEICARFYIYCSHKFSEQSLSSFSFKLNNDQTINCLQSLKEFYDDPLTENSPNEAEFRAYTILLNFNDASVLAKIGRLRPEIRNSCEVKSAINLYFAYNSRNYVKFFRLIKNDKNLKYISTCLVHRYFAQMRVEAVRSMAMSFKTRSKSTSDEYKCLYPFYSLCEILCFDDEEDANFFCDQLNIEIFTNDLDEKMVLLPLDKNLPEKPVMDRLNAKCSQLVESKFNADVERLSDIIYGSKIDCKDVNYTLQQQSFNSQGMYIGTDLPDLENESSRQPQTRIKTPPSPPRPSGFTK